MHAHARPSAPFRACPPYPRACRTRNGAPRPPPSAARGSTGGVLAERGGPGASTNAQPAVSPPPPTQHWLRGGHAVLRATTTGAGAGRWGGAGRLFSQRACCRPCASPPQAPTPHPPPHLTPPHTHLDLGAELGEELRGKDQVRRLCQPNRLCPPPLRVSLAVPRQPTHIQQRLHACMCVRM